MAAKISKKIRIAGTRFTPPFLTLINKQNKKEIPTLQIIRKSVFLCSENRPYIL